MSYTSERLFESSPSFKAYANFSNQVKKQVKKQNPKKKDYEICKIVGEMWINLNSNEKLKYYPKNLVIVKNPIYLR